MIYCNNTHILCVLIIILCSEALVLCHRKHGLSGLPQSRTSWLYRGIIGEVVASSMPISTLKCQKQELTDAPSSVQDIKAIHREDFPILDQDAHPGKPLVYLDSAASSQKPAYVIDTMNKYYRTTHSNVHRGAHALAARATTQYEEARDQVKAFINAKLREEIVFTRGATEAINLVVSSWGESQLQEGDEIVLSVMEHHSNIVPWQMLAERKGLVIKYARLKDNEEDQTLDMEHMKTLITPRTKVVSMQHASNVLATCHPVAEVISLAHGVGAKVLLDACQSVPHMKVDVQALDVDFLVASSHKMCGPTGVGFLYGKTTLLQAMPPVQGGGEMIDTVTLEGSTFAMPPSRFEAGTPAIAEAIGLGAACEYLNKVGMHVIEQHEQLLGEYLYRELEKVPGLTLYGPHPDHQHRTGLVAFNCDTVHATDLSFFLDQEGVAVRTGHHCAQPLHKELGAAGSVRASLYFYNSKADVDTFVAKLKEVIAMFAAMEQGESMF